LIGSGKIGSTVARLGVAAGHSVMLTNSRGSETLTDLAGELGPLARAATGAVTVMVPHYAMSGETLIAPGAREIALAPSAVLAPVDPQIGQHPAASILAAVQRKDINRIDEYRTKVTAITTPRLLRRTAGQWHWE